MSPISDDTKKALDQLNTQIAAAERKLKTLPGSRHEDSFVEIDERNGVSEGLQFMVCDAEERLCIVWLHSHDGEVVKKTPLVDMPITQRIEASVHIGDLIDLARDSEKKIAAEAIEAADRIEQALAR